MNITSAPLAHALDSAQPGILFDSGQSPQQATQAALGHPGAQIDQTGALTLPPVQAGPLGQAGTPQGLGSQLAAQTGVARVRLNKTDDTISLVGEINPNFELVPPTTVPSMLTDRLRDPRLQQRFDTAKWGELFGLSARRSQENVQEARTANQIVQVNDRGRAEFVVVPIPRPEILSMIKETIVATGRQSPLLYTQGTEKTFRAADVKTFLRGSSRLPNVPELDDLTLIAAALTDLKAMTELKLTEGSADVYYFAEMPPTRQLPDAWNADTCRLQLYINGSGYNPAMRDAVRRRGWQEVQDVLALRDAGNPAWQLQWRQMAARRLVINEAFDAAKVGYYRAADMSCMDADHEPALADQWNSDGWDSPVADRQAHARNVSPMNERENKSKNANENFKTKDAGPNFKGHFTETIGKWWADNTTPFKNAPPSPPRLR